MNHSSVVEKLKTESARLHLGCGHEILPGFVNLDSVALKGVDVVHDLGVFPWPFQDGSFDEILLRHVLEHLPNTLQTMEEIWRICRPGAKVTIRVPYWNSRDFITDPTHIRPFNEHTFDFFDPREAACRERSYYSVARFHIRRKLYFVRVFGRYPAVRGRFMGWILECLAHFFCNIIQVMEIELSAVKEPRDKISEPNEGGR